MEQPSLKERVERITEYIGDFLEAQKDLAIASATLKVSELFSGLVFFVIIAIFVAIFIVFAAVALGFWLSSIIGNEALGFLGAGGIFLLIGLLCILLKKPITGSFKNMVVKQVYDNDKDL